MRIKKTQDGLMKKLRNIDGFQAIGYAVDENDESIENKLLVLWDNYDTEHLVPERFGTYDVEVVINHGPCPCPYCSAGTTMN